MIWQSIALMTVIDAVILVVAATAWWLLRRHQSALAGAAGRLGPGLIGVALAAIGLFYLADLATMWLLPRWITPDGARRAMEVLHLEYHWLVTLLVVGLLVTGLARTLQDLAAQRSALVGSTRKYQQLYERTPVMLHSLDADGLVTTVSDVWLETLGYRREEVLGRPGTSFLTADSRRHSESACLPRFLERGVLENEPLQFETRDGRVIDVLLSATTLSSHGEGSSERSLSASIDVTELNRTRRERDELLRLHELMLESAGEGVYGIDPAGSLTFINRAGAAMLGWVPEERIGRPMDEMGHHRQPEGGSYTASNCPIYAAFRTCEPQRIKDDVFWREDGSSFPVEVTSTPILDGDEALGAVVVFRDLTERRLAEEESRRAFREVERLKEELENERDYLREEVAVSFKFGEIIGNSTALRRVLSQIEAVAATGATVLVLGESGVGKELVARAIHRHSSRSGPLVKVNCASIPRELFESEFFGHVKGAFTGAHRDRIGRFQLANHGTLFLDEVGETPLELQGKLLRVLEEGEFERIGEGVSRRVDVRLLAATNRDLRREVEAGRFREDLYFRLSVFPIEVPPLRERRDDIVPLAKHFLDLACREFGCHDVALSRHQAEALSAYEWPGNVRELRNVMERAVILSPGRRLRLDRALPGLVSAAPADPPSHELSAESDFLTAEQLKRLERDNLLAALEAARWRVSGDGGAAHLLGMKASTVRYQMKAMGIERPA